MLVTKLITSFDAPAVQSSIRIDWVVPLPQVCSLQTDHAAVKILLLASVFRFPVGVKVIRESHHFHRYRNEKRETPYSYISDDTGGGIM